ncbi:MAG: lytic transglycosylase domain-containing protein [Sphingomicrobium sp.]
MSSMWRPVLIFVAALAAPSSGLAQYVPPAGAAPSYTYASSQSASAWLGTWRALRQSSNYRFSDYAPLLIANPDWPDASKMRRWAERAMRPGENNATVLTFFSRDKPVSGNGWARLADAYAASGRMTEALDAARNAWGSGDLAGDDEQGLWSRYGASFARTDHDRRVDALLVAKKPDDAARFLTLATPARQAAFGARVAMLRNSADADSRYQYVAGLVTSDAGLMMDRARYLRANNYDHSAQQLVARDHNFTYRPADPERFYELLVVLANQAAADRQWSTAFYIASQLDDVLPTGQKVADQTLGIRDDYTTLAWLAGNVALDRLNRPSSAIAMFARYGTAGRSLQVQTKGNYWAGRAALAAGQVQTANAYFGGAAAYPELFYGQLALERLGRSVQPPPQALAQYTVTAVQRSAFNGRPIVQAMRLLGQQGRSTEQAVFVRALSESLNTDSERNLAVELGDQLRRPDLAVWTARSARVKGSMFYVRQAFPMLGGSVSPSLWSVTHGISRQESSFDPIAISHAGARGMMQLMPGTAREQAGKLGVGYDSYRLISDPAYNVMLGSAYFQRMLNTWDGNVPLAVASYNAGAGNVRKWVNAYGDPRGRVDVVKWIEAIPFLETRSYVQRVIENSVVYDSLRRTPAQRSAMHVSRYLGKDRPG